MNLKFPYFLLQTVPFWMIGLQGVASAQVSLPSPPPATSLTNIQSATSDTTVVQEANQFNILGGQSSDGTEPNLIHQFQNFDLDTGDTANFVVNPDVANVISLINSIQPSSVDGILSLISSDPDVASAANLFLVNPAGIIFGENVSLNLPANLTATTSSGLLFEDQFLLSIDGSISEIALPTEKTPDNASILDNASGISMPVEVPIASPKALTTPIEAPTISNLNGVPNGYVFLIESEGLEPSTPFSPTLPAGSIENQGNLQVTSQASITLIGQYIQNDGSLVAPGGAVSLVAIATSGENLIRLSQPGSLLSLEVIPADELTVLSSSAEQSSVAALPASEIAGMLTGGNEESATQIQVNADGSQVLTSTPLLTPAPGSVLVRGKVDVSDSTPSEQDRLPGQVNILGNQINLIGADIHADGVSQAGTISIGNTSGADGFSAAFILVDRSSDLSAISLDANGGTIQIVADDTVSFFGDATVTGVSTDLDGTILIEAGNLVDIRQPGPVR